MFQQQQPPRGGQPPHPGGWFSGAPSSKVFIMASVVSFLFVQNRGDGEKFQFDSLSMTGRGSSFFRFLTSKIFFLTSGELVVGTSLLLHLMRKYEREMGTRKFLCFYLLQYPATIIQEIMLLQLLATRNLVLDLPSPMKWQYAGPYGLIGALFTLFHTYAPRIHPRFISALGFHFSEKSFYYIWFFYFAASGGWSTLIPTATGIATAVLYVNTPFLANLLIPTSLVRTFQPLFERLGFGGAPPPLPPVVPARGRPRPRPTAAPRREEPIAIPVPEPDPEAIELLTGMGFPRAQVTEALRQTHNNVEHAANRLVGGS